MTMINHGSTFLVCDDRGAIDEPGEHGIFACDTRFVSRWSLALGTHGLHPLGEQRPHFSSARWDLLSPEVATAANGIVSDLAVSIERVIADRQLHEDINVEHYGSSAVTVDLRLRVECDFADIFEVRSRDWQPRDVETRWDGESLRHEYHGPERFLRIHDLRITASPPLTLRGGILAVTLTLPPGGRWHACLHHRLLDSAVLELPALPCPRQGGSRRRIADSRRRRERSTVDWATLHPGEPRLDAAVTQARADLESLALRSGRHTFPAAGIPWFATLFGRDSLICSLQTMLLGPEYALGTLDQLARLQARSVDRYRDAEPGKIAHEMRIGEWALTGRIPQRPYYGSADSTSLYLMTLGELYRWHGDAEKLRRFRSPAERCLRWLDYFGDMDGDGLQEYGPREATGFPNQCWRDSPDGVPDETGACPPHPIATCELQGYAYAAKLALAPLFEAWGDAARAARLREEARLLKVRFNEAFWVPGLDLIALALDGDKRQVTSLSSNPGHCLWTGIVDSHHVADVAEQLTSARLFSGFGVRTLAADHAVYDPHSYHRGSVWPHDTVIAAAGLRLNGHEEEAWRVIEGLVGAASRLPHRQLPELFSGLDHRSTPQPVPYWRANLPQAWASGSMIHAVSVLLGIQPDVPAGRLHLSGTLPSWCPSLRVSGLRLGESRFDLIVHRTGYGVDVDVRGGGGDSPPEIVLGPRPA
jgi:glycogen debranching enzyme